MQFNEPPETNYAGSLLVAHPGLTDPNFEKSVVLVSAHSEDEGSLGVVINRPIGKTLGEYNADFQFGPLYDVPLYEGGPVGSDQMILTAWSWSKDKGVFKLYFGLSLEKANDLIIEEPEADIRGFLGYSGWGKGQLSAECSSNAWVLSNIDSNALDGEAGDDMWKRLIGKFHPELRFLADSPDDPSWN